MKLNYKKMLQEIDALVETDFVEHMDLNLMPHSNPYTQEDAEHMAQILGQIYMVSHCLTCTACQTKYKIYKK